MDGYQICKRCVMDTSDTGIVFDAQGHCSVCNAYTEAVTAHGYRQGVSDDNLRSTVERMKRKNRNRAYDAILGLSGGVDSAYLLYLAHQLGLRVLAVHVDTGWNSEIAVRNIERMCGKLGVALHTVVIDWPAMKELQRAYMLSGVANLDVPQDHILMASLMRYAKKHRLNYMLSGANLATEGSGTPFSKQQSYMDTRHIRSIYRRHGRGKSLRKYRMLTFPQACWAHLRIQKVCLLNDIPYSKKEAIEVLSRNFGWEYYGGKHFESRFTKYFQSVYLPQKFGFDKRRHHLSCIVMNGEISRDEALAELALPPYPPAQQQEDEEYILKKLDISQEQWKQILASPPTPNSAYASQAGLMRLGKELNKRFFR